jgi:hypothetical protein
MATAYPLGGVPANDRHLDTHVTVVAQACRTREYQQHAVSLCLS